MIYIPSIATFDSLSYSIKSVSSGIKWLFNYNFIDNSISELDSILLSGYSGNSIKTFLNDDGHITPVEENYFYNSNDITESGWQNVRCDVIEKNYFSQAAGETNGAVVYQVFIELSKETFAYASCKVKKAEKNFLRFFENISSSGASTYVDLENKRLGTVSSYHTAKIELLDDDWVKLHIFFKPADTAYTQIVAFYLADTDNSTVVTDSGGIYLADAQCAKYKCDYIETFDERIINQPRWRTFHSDLTPAGWLLESRTTTNMIYYSSELNDSWYVNRIIPTYEPDTWSPVKGDCIRLTTIDELGEHAIKANVDQVLANQNYVAYYILKASETGRWIKLRFSSAFGGAVNAWFNFDLLNGVEGLSDLSDDTYIDHGAIPLPNDWWIVWICCYPTVTYPGQSMLIFLPDDLDGSDPGTQFVGDFLMCGSQFELGDYPTSYIPTYGVPLTRVSETLDLSLLNSDESSILISWEQSDYTAGTVLQTANNSLGIADQNTSYRITTSTSYIDLPLIGSNKRIASILSNSATLNNYVAIRDSDSNYISNVITPSTFVTSNTDASLFVNGVAYLRELKILDTSLDEKSSQTELNKIEL